MQKTADEVTVKQVHIKDDFWSEIQNRIINVVIPFQEHVLNDEVEGVAKSHAIENFRIAAGLSTGEFYGMVFQDSDVAKWLEGVAYSLTVKPDAALEKRADDIIDIIEKAQQPDVEALTQERDAAQKELLQLKNEKVLTAKGVKADDLDYVLFKVSKLVDDKTDFAKAAERFLKENPRYTGAGTYRVSTSTGEDNQSGGSRNSSINDVIRAAARR